MKIFTRDTVAGKEFWDTELKKTILVPFGSKADAQAAVETIIVPTENTPSFDDMTIKELKQYAEDNTIDIPSDVTKKDDIIAFLVDFKVSDAE